MDEAVKRFGRVDILVNNAGYQVCPASTQAGHCLPGIRWCIARPALVLGLCAQMMPVHAGHVRVQLWPASAAGAPCLCCKPVCLADAWCGRVKPCRRVLQGKHVCCSSGCTWIFQPALHALALSCALETLQGDQVDDFTKIDRKRLEFVFNTNIIAMCAAEDQHQP